jgi:ubiquinone/menaquinone biosynthesis C-methylase UbiE
MPPGARAIEVGAGTGLLGLALLDGFSELVLADESSGMLDAARAKVAAAGYRNVRVVALNLVSDPPPAGAPFDVVLSQLLLHHVRDTHAALEAMHRLLVPGGLLIAADLDAEDGSFHGPNRPDVHHEGFERDALGAVAESAGFRDVAFGEGGRIEREDGTFGMFLLTARS